MVEELKPAKPRNRTGRNTAGRRAGAGRWLPLLSFAGVALFILQSEVPAVRMYLERYLKPDVHQANMACYDAVLLEAAQPATARIVDHGRNNKTQSGYYVDGIVLGEMGQEGREVRTRYGCYTDETGNVIRAETMQKTESECSN